MREKGVLQRFARSKVTIFEGPNDGTEIGKMYQIDMMNEQGLRKLC
jgi:hypothetical protein